MGWWKQPRKVCFLCSGKYGDDYGEIEYGFTENGVKKTDRKKICALCVARLDKNQMSEVDDEQDKPV